MKIKILLLLFNFFAVLISAQTKGASPITVVSDQSSVVSNTYAVVIGISDYQDPAIPDLRFADKDAEAFANYLRSNAVGKLDNDHLKLLVNQKATMAQFANALDWLLENAKEGDQTIVYFSGHGDVEKKTLTQPGFLLCWDAPSRVYMAGGAFALSMLQEVITTLTTQNKSKVIVIADACRSGKLSGSSVNGNQLTNANLAKQYANEIKMLSCQPNEYSVEGMQWGGGRGIFSYYLMEALTGSADKNHDGNITSFEVGRFLEDSVFLGAKPQSQLPMIIGDKSEIVARVWHNKDGWGSGDKSSSEGGWESGDLDTSQQVNISFDEVNNYIISSDDPVIPKLYGNLINRINEKKFFEPVADCADYYFNQLISNLKSKEIHKKLQIKYSTALQEDAQQIINKMLKVDLTEVALDKKLKLNKYKEYPHQIQRAIDLLGTSNLLHKHLQSMKYFFEGLILSLENTLLDQSIGRICVDKFQTALNYSPDLPYVYNQLCLIYGKVFKMEDSTEYYGKKALEVHPGWTLPLSNLAYIFSTSIKKPKKVKHYLKLASAIDPNAPIILNYWGNYYVDNKRYNTAEQYFKKSLAQDSEYVDPYYNLACLYSLQNRIESAFVNLEKAIVLGYDYDWINSDPDLINIKNAQEQWKKLMIKYYPQINDK